MPPLYRLNYAVIVPEMWKHQDMAHSHGEGRRAACPASPHNGQLAANLAYRSHRKLQFSFCPCMKAPNLN